MLPSFVVGMRQRARRGLPRIGNRSDQGDQLARPVAFAVGHLVLDHPHGPGLVFVQVLAAARGLDQLLPRLALDLAAD